MLMVHDIGAIPCIGMRKARNARGAQQESERNLLDLALQ